ncbi:hypothetical protein Sjap_003598 [Stephania japonica]|uniref:FBD domain-containing protein n=1 Tax=Stephania japonica TaxID=461633 RepID=A0AAP0KP45_9MAGN
MREYLELGFSKLSMLRHLKVLEFRGVIGCINEFKLLQSVLENAMILEKILIWASEYAMPSHREKGFESFKKTLSTELVLCTHINRLGAWVRSCPRHRSNLNAGTGPLSVGSSFRLGKRVRCHPEHRCNQKVQYPDRSLSFLLITQILLFQSNLPLPLSSTYN